MLRYDLLGRLTVRRDGVQIDLGARKQRALLAMLLINANRVVSTDELLDALWADGAAQNPQNVMWVNVSKVRSAIDPGRTKGSDSTVLVTQAPGYMLVTDADAIDAARFEKLASEGRALVDVDPAAASLVFNEALALWNGRALEEFTYDEFAQPEIARLEELRLTTVEHRVDADLQVGLAHELVGELEGLTRLHPLRERLAAQLMIALHRTGRQGEALRAFGTFRTTLAEELGLDPSTALVALEERIVLDDPSLRLSEPLLVPVGAPTATQPVRGYELRARLGDGPSGVVHVAYQPTVGREVALKVFHSELADDPSFVRNFDADSTAGLDHPRIVATLDRWRQPGAAYVTMPVFESNLQARLDRGSLPLDDALRVIDHVAEALGAAHRAGVVHGDVKPTNVLLDADGNAFLADFSTLLSGPTGSLTTRSDLSSLTLLAGRILRCVDERESRRTERAAALLERDTADDPETVARDVREALGVRPGGQHPARIENPYVGLQAFQERDARRFFGRERLVERLLARLGRTGVQGRLIVLVGPSGAGKSSVVRAGVLPALRDDSLTDADRWFHAMMTPGADPFASLALALRSVATAELPELAVRLRRDGIAVTTSAVLPEPDARLALVVDQLEELFTHASADDASAFLDALATSAEDPHSPIKIIATLRADHYDRPMQHRPFGELLRHATELITPMSVAELEQATVAPAAAVGVTFEAGLVSEIVADVSGQASALPLLQYAMTELFDRRRGTTISAAAYREIGGVTGALVQTADNVYDGFDEVARAQVRDVFLRLVTLGDGGADTRRRVLVSELTGVGADHVPDILETFGRHRLLSFDRDPVTRGPTVEIAHEALLTEWRRLADWIDRARADVEAQRSLAALAATWRDHDRDPSFLLAEGPAGRYAGWIERPPVRLTALEADFLTASVTAVDDRRVADIGRVRRLRRLVGVTGAALVIALFAGGLAVRQRNSAQSSANDARLAQSEAIDAAAAADASAAVAESSTQEAEASAAEAESATLLAEAAAAEAQASADAADLATLVSRSAALGTDDPTVAVLLAVEAHRRSATPETIQAVIDAVTSTNRDRLVVSRTTLTNDAECGGTPGAIPFPTMGTTFEVALVDGRFVSRNTLTGELTDAGLPPAPCALGGRSDTIGFAQSPDGLRGWVGTNFENQLTFAPGTRSLHGTSSRLLMFTVPGDGLDTLSLYDATTGDLVGELVDRGSGMSIGHSDELGLYAVGFATPSEENPAVVTVLDDETLEVRFELGFDKTPMAVEFDPATNELLAAFDDAELVTIDLDSRAVVASTEAIVSPKDIGVGPDGVVTVGSPNQVVRLDRRTGLLPGTLDIGSGQINVMVIRPDGLITTVSNTSRRIEVFSFTGGGLAEQVVDISASAEVAVIDGWASVLERGASELQLVDLATGGRQVQALVDSNGNPVAADLAYPEPDGAWTVSPDYVLTRWEGDEPVDQLFLGATPDARAVIRGGPGPNGARSGNLYASLGSGADGQEVATLVELEREDPRVLFRAEVSDTAKVIPSIDGGLHVIDGSGMMTTYDASGAIVDEVPTGVENASSAIAVDPVSGTVAITSGTGLVSIVDPTTSTSRDIPVPDLAVSLGFAGPSGTLVITGRDGRVRLWDVGAWESVGVFLSGDDANPSKGASYDAASDTFTAVTSGRITTISLDPDRWIERACLLANRELTADEWDRWVPGDEPRTSACS